LRYNFTCFLLQELLKRASKGLPTKAARLLAAEVTEGHGAKMTGVGGAAPADGGVVALLADVEHTAAAEKAAPRSTEGVRGRSLCSKRVESKPAFIHTCA
jgi:hypothetical protein